MTIPRGVPQVTQSEVWISFKYRSIFTLRESRVMPSRHGGIGKGSQYVSTASPLPSRICSILGFCNIEVYYKQYLMLYKIK